MSWWDTLSVELQDRIEKDGQILHNKDLMLQELMSYDKNGVQCLQKYFCKDWTDSMFRWIRTDDFFELEEVLHRITMISKEGMIYNYWEEELDDFRELFEIDEVGILNNGKLREYMICHNIHMITMIDNSVQFHTMDYYKYICELGTFFRDQLDPSKMCICYDCMKEEVTKENQGHEIFCGRCEELNALLQI